MAECTTPLLPSPYPVPPQWMKKEYLTADGAQHGVAAWSKSTDACCDLVECVDVCRMACTFISLLPSGPMWDTQKRRAIEHIRSMPCTDPITLPDDCSGLVAHAVYKAQILVDLVNNAIWPSQREANPFTAVDSLDSWLEMLGWFDCYRTTCRSVILGDLTAFEMLGDCGPIYCGEEYGDDLDCAVKRGIISSLTRMHLGFIDNLAGINWVIEPLGAILRPLEKEGPTQDCCNFEFEICNYKDTLPACDNTVQGCYDQRPKEIAAWSAGACGIRLGRPLVIWPGVIAAECIVRSILHQQCPNILHTCNLCEPTT